MGKDKIVRRKEDLQNEVTPKGTVQDKQIIRITEWAVDRSRKDTIDWRMALMQAESPLMPRRWLLTNLYREIELDPHMIMLMNRFRRDISGKPFIMKNKKTGKPDTEAVKLLLKRWFFDVLKYKAKSKFSGNSLMQINEFDKGEIKSVELVNPKFVIPNLGCYIDSVGSQNLIDYRNDPTLKPWIFEADSGDFGYMNPAAPYVLFKRNAFIAWSEFCEIFGLPIRYVETDNITPKDVDRIKNALVNMGKNAYGIFHTGESLKFAETQRTDSYNVFYMLSNAVNAELSKMVLGETLTSETGGKSGSKAQGSVHQNTSDETAEENRRDNEIWVNETVLPVLNLQGYGLENFEFSYPKEANYDPNQWAVYQGLLAAYDIDPQFFVDQYGVPITGKKAVQPNPANPGKEGGSEGGEDDEVNGAELALAVKEAATGSFKNIVKLHKSIEELYNHKHS
jgi:hypothetical protein